MTLSTEKAAEESVGIVVIGRNEGERLRKCLKSIRESTSSRLVYVDSGSSDDSLAIARSFEAGVLELDPRSPFSAARARNEGFRYLKTLSQEIQFVQFVDGDCILMPDWLDHAREALREDLRRAAVLGHVQELNPDATPYNRLCALEWVSKSGDLTNFGSFGGISMIRMEVLDKLGGFNADVIAGEDSELGVRMQLAGYKITKLDQPMVIHDANITSFSQWWKRSVRAGHAIGQRSQLNGKTELRDCIRERNSTWVWGIAIPLLVLVTLIPSYGLSVFLLCGYLLLYFRVIRYRRNQGDSPSDASLYARFLLMAKFANGMGLIKYYVNKFEQRYEIIEYK